MSDNFWGKRIKSELMAENADLRKQLAESQRRVEVLEGDLRVIRKDLHSSVQLLCESCKKRTVSLRLMRIYRQIGSILNKEGE